MVESKTVPCFVRIILGDIEMRIMLSGLMTVILILFAMTASATDWVGQTVLVTKDTLLCDYFHMQKVRILRKAGDFQSVAAYIMEGYCTNAPKSFYATITSDTSSFDDYALVEVVYKGKSAWASKGSPLCCYLKSGDELILYNPNKKGDLIAVLRKAAVATDKARRAEFKTATPNKRLEECDRARQHLKDLKGAGLTGTAQYKRETDFVAACAAKD